MEINGLTTSEVNKRIKQGKVNIDTTPKTKSIKQILKDNIFTYFNFLNLVLGLAVFIAGTLKGDIIYGLKNCLFMGVIITNSIISIVEEIISKKIIDKLSVLSVSKVNVIRNNIEETIMVNDIVEGDVLHLLRGDQIPTDSIVLSGKLEVNEALITGESNAILKHVNDELLSGSYVVSGDAYVKVIHVGLDNYVAIISKEAKYNKRVESVIMSSFTKLLKILSIMIIPIGIIMYISQYYITHNAVDSIFTTVAALIGMIPEGLVLLTSSVMAVGVIKLYRVHVLVQELNAIEILARVDTICLDKTGTLTENKLSVSSMILNKGYTEQDFRKYLGNYLYSTIDNNQTIEALRSGFTSIQAEKTNSIEFSSDRKYSAIEFNDYTLYLGAPDILSKDNKKIEKYLEDYRIVALGIKNSKISDKLNNIDIIGYVLLEDVIRESAKDTLEYFKNNNVDVKIISGDNSKTVSTIAKKLGLDNYSAIDVGELNEEEIKSIINDYQVFGRVKPQQKKWIVKYLKEAGHTVAMTGDGVNDVLALKESDCAISIKSGSDAARNVSQLILLNDDFNSLPNVVKEGRQTINNVERSGSLLLVKTIYTLLLITFSILVSQKYFFIPIQLTFITSFTIGIPSFVLALEPNDKIVEGNFLFRMLSRALPTALTVVFIIAIVTAFTSIFDMSYDLQTTLCVYLTTIIGLVYLYKICIPFSIGKTILFCAMLIGFILSSIMLPDIFNLLNINPTILLIVFVLSIDALYIYKLLNYFITLLFNKFDNTIRVERDIYSLK